jgi:CheY-like chemotaxis protein
MDGLQAMQRQRARECELGYPRIPAVAVTAHAFEDERVRALDAGFDDFVTKPIDLAALEAAIARVVGAPDMRSEAAAAATTPL